MSIDKGGESNDEDLGTIPDGGINIEDISIDTLYSGSSSEGLIPAPQQPTYRRVVVPPALPQNASALNTSTDPDASILDVSMRSIDGPDASVQNGSSNIPVVNLSNGSGSFDAASSGSEQSLQGLITTPNEGFTLGKEISFTTETELLESISNISEQEINIFRFFLLDQFKNIFFVKNKGIKEEIRIEQSMVDEIHNSIPQHILWYMNKDVLKNFIGSWLVEERGALNELSAEELDETFNSLLLTSRQDIAKAAEKLGEIANNVDPNDSVQRFISQFFSLVLSEAFIDNNTVDDLKAVKASNRKQILLQKLAGLGVNGGVALATFMSFKDPALGGLTAALTSLITIHYKSSILEIVEQGQGVVAAHIEIIKRHFQGNILRKILAPLLLASKLTIASAAIGVQAAAVVEQGGEILGAAIEQYTPEAMQSLVDKAEKLIKELMVEADPNKSNLEFVIDSLEDLAPDNKYGKIAVLLLLASLLGLLTTSPEVLLYRFRSKSSDQTSYDGMNLRHLVENKHLEDVLSLPILQEIFKQNVGQDNLETQDIKTKLTQILELLTRSIRDNNDKRFLGLAKYFSLKSEPIKKVDALMEALQLLYGTKGKGVLIRQEIEKMLSGLQLRSVVPPLPAQAASRQAQTAPKAVPPPLSPRTARRFDPNGIQTLLGVQASQTPNTGVQLSGTFIATVNEAGAQIPPVKVPRSPRISASAKPRRVKTPPKS